MNSGSIASHKRQQLLTQLFTVQMTRGVFRKPQLNRSGKFLGCLVAIAMHIPATLRKPVLELLERHFFVEVFRQLLPNLVFSDHDPLQTGRNYYT
jgi:hypothetical protein